MPLECLHLMECREYRVGVYRLKGATAELVDSETLPLSGREWRYAKSARHEAVQRERIAACLGLKDLLQDPASELSHAQSGRPLSSNSQSISITHKQGVVGVAIANGSGGVIGIDLECPDEPRNVPLLVRYGATERDLEFMERFSNRFDADLNRSFTALWCLKEAVAKAYAIPFAPAGIAIQMVDKDNYNAYELGVCGEWKKIPLRQAEVRWIEVRRAGCLSVVFTP